MGIEGLKSPARLLDRDYVNKGGLDLFKKVLWVSVGLRAAEIRARGGSSTGAAGAFAPAEI